MEAVEPSTYRALAGDRLVAVDADGERLTDYVRAEDNRRFDMDTDADLDRWRERQGITRQTVSTFACGECGQTFETAAALNGHQSAHAGAGRQDKGASPDAVDPEDLPFTVEDVEAADLAGLRDMASEVPSIREPGTKGPDRLRLDLKAALGVES
mgnify:CR=1 FL=1